jgi:hypothetical protein
MIGQFGKSYCGNQTGTGWDNTRGVINMDNEWWKKNESGKYCFVHKF